MTVYLSNKLRVLSFVLICMVVLLHAQIIQMSPNGISVFIQQLFTEKITRIAVSFFFIISGFLFAYTIDERQIVKSFKYKINKRIKTLLVPYVIWSIICILLFGVLQVLIPSLTETSKSIVKYTFNDYLNEFIINPSLAYQLWFIRDLFVVSILSPIIFILLKHLKILLIIFLLLISIYFWYIGFLSITSLTFFSLGMYMAMFHKSEVEYIFSNRIYWIIPLLWIIFNIIITYTKYESSIIFLLNKLVGIMAIWISYDLLYHDYIKRWLSIDVFSYAFLIYLMHEPTLTLCKKVYINTIGVTTTISSLLFYFICPFALISIIIFIGKILKKRLPRAYRVLTGSR